MSIRAGKAAGPKKFPKLPCGCPGGLQRNGGNLIIMKDGTRACYKHGRRFKLVWEEVYEWD